MFYFLVLFFVILRIEKFLDYKLIESKWPILKFNHIKYFLPNSFFFFLKAYFIQGQYYIQFFLTIWNFLLELITDLLISFHVCDSVSQIFPFLVRVIPVEYIERLTVHKGFIVGYILVSHSVCRGYDRTVSGSSVGIENISRRVTFLPKG